MNPSSGDLPDPAPPADPSAPRVPAPASSANAVAAVDADEPPPSGERVGGVVVALRRFLASKQPDEGRRFVRAVVIRKLYGSKPKKEAIDGALVDDLTHAALERALTAKSPPWTERGIPGWVARVTKCAVADYFRGLEDDEENLDREADVTNWSNRHEPPTDSGAREHLIAKFLESKIGHDPYKLETFRLMMEARVVGRSLEELARAHHTTPHALKMRFQRLTRELVPHVSLMDREKPRRAILLALLFFGAFALVALLVAVLWGALRPAAPPAVPALEPPAPSASAPPAPGPAPRFDDALPTKPGPAPTRDVSPAPQDLKPPLPRPRNGARPTGPAK